MSASPYEEPNINPATDQQQQFMDNNNNPNDFSYPDDADEDVDDEIRAHRQQQMLANDPREAGVEHVNFLLEILSMKAERPVLRLSQLSSSFFVLAFKQLFGDVPEGVNISPQTIDDRINNARVVIESIESKLDMSLAHISPELVATHDELHIAKLLRVFVDIVTPSEGEMMGLAGDDTRGDEDEEGDERSTAVDDHQQQQHQLFGQLHSVNAQYGGSTSKQSATPQQQQQQRSGQQQQHQQQAGNKKQQQQQQPAAASGVRPQPQVMVRDWLTGLYSHGSYERQQPDSFESQLHEGDHHSHQQQQDGAEHQHQQQQNNENINSSNNQQQNTNNMDPQYAFNNNQQHPPLYQQQFDGIKQQQQQQDGYNNNMMMNDPTTANYEGQQYYQNTNSNNNQNQQNMMPVGGDADQQHQHLSSTIAEARRVRRVADFIERSNIPRYQTQLCKRLSDNDGRYVRQFTGDGPLSTIGVASMQKQSTTNNASMARRPLPAMTNARRDAKIEKLRAEKFLQNAQDRAVREVVRQASREEVRMVQELKQQLAEQRQTFLSLDKLAKEKDQRLRQIYNDNVISSVGAAKNKGVKLNLHKNAADLVRREREVVEREKQECESEIRLQFEVLRAKRESYLSHLSSWRVAVMKQQDTTTTAAPVPTSSRQGHKTGGSSKKQQQQQQLHSATSSARQSQQQQHHHVDPHSSYQQQPTAVVA